MSGVISRVMKRERELAREAKQQRKAERREARRERRAEHKREAGSQKEALAMVIELGPETTIHLPGSISESAFLRS
jgi:hypothetical protein